MTKLNAKTIAWLKDTLTNDEYASDEEMLEYFINEGKLAKAEAEKWVNLRSAFIFGRPKQVARIRRATACPHCDFFQLYVVIHQKGWMLECVQCGDMLSEKEQQRCVMEPFWQLVTPEGYVRC
jgi:hypothetical protein